MAGQESDAIRRARQLPISVCGSNEWDALQRGSSELEAAATGIALIVRLAGWKALDCRYERCGGRDARRDGVSQCVRARNICAVIDLDCVQESVRF
jgi:hypothetical protein